MTNRILFRGIFLYLIYVFIFAIVLFFFQKPKVRYFSKDDIDKKDNLVFNDDKVALIESGENGILVRLNMLLNAKETIDISYYTLTGGRSVKLVLASLLAAADRGVKVRILFDGIFHNLSGELKDASYALSAHPNIEFKLYEPFKFFRPRTWNNRLHDKLIIVDKKLALIGGRNIGDKYFDKDNSNHQYSKDRDVIIYDAALAKDEASSVMAMCDYFDEVFDYVYSTKANQKLSKRKSVKAAKISQLFKKELIIYKEKYPDKIKEIDWQKMTQKTDGVEFVYNPIARGNQDPFVLRKLLSLASQAQQSVLIQSPYVILSNEMENKFEGYNLPLNKIKILTNSIASSPNPIAFAGYFNSKHTLVDSGISVYEYQGPKSLHGKTYIYDNKISAIGSFNFDARSSYINSEIMVIIHSETFAEKLRSYVEVDLSNSLKVRDDYTYKTDTLVDVGFTPKSKQRLIKYLAKVVYFIHYLL